MSARDLAERVDLDPSTVLRLERSERDRRIQLDTLDKLAQALDCEVVYALVPRRPLEQVVDDQALKVAKVALARVDHTMRLEAQGVTEGHRERAADLARELKGRPGLWHAASTRS